MPPVAVADSTPDRVAQRHREGLASGVAALRQADAGDRVRLIDPDRLCRRRHRNRPAARPPSHAIVCAGLALLLPKLSVAVSVMVSGVPDVAVPSLSCKRREVVIHLAQRAADGQGSPGGGTPVPSVAVVDSTPDVSLSVTVKVSPVVLPLSDRLTPVIACV